MKKIIAILAVLMAVATVRAGVDGDWRGVLDIMGQKLPLALHVSEKGCTLDSPDQGAYDLLGEVTYRSDDSLSIAIPQLQLKYEARLQFGILKGTFRQGAFEAPLVMTRGVIARNRPQTPKPPFPYSTQEITFRSSLDTAQLAGTLTLAPQEGAPLVVMVSGSGQQNRDEEIMGHKPFAVLADWLARNGVSSFRYDDRGMGASNGIREDLTTEISKEDAHDALLKMKELTKASAYGVLGHSEGGLIAFMIGAEYPQDVDFLVTIGAPAVNLEHLLHRQLSDRFGGQADDATINQQIEAMKTESAWMRWFLDYDVTQPISKLSTPLLAIYGENDQQVYADENPDTLRAALPTSCKAEVVVMPGLNHLLQHSSTGNPIEYGKIEETMSPEAMQTISDWILSR